MISKLPSPVQSIDYEKEAQLYLESLPPEHFMESTSQSTQRAITMASLALVTARRPDFQVFSELLVQYPRRGQSKPGQVVPDNMVVISAKPVLAKLSYNLPRESASPYWVLEYVSESNKRKDYEDSRRKYERELKVPYFLLFHPDVQELTLYRHNQRRYVKAKPNEHQRFAIPELDLEVRLLDEWVRYWYKGELLPLPSEMLRELDAIRLHLEQTLRQAEVATRRADEVTRRAEQTIRQAEDVVRRANDFQHRLEDAEKEIARLRARQ